jgi:arylsulfate sulfotransferase
MKIAWSVLALGAVVLLISCGDSSRKGNPLVYQYSVNAAAGSAVAVEFGPDTNYGFTTSSIVVPEGETSVNVQVAGMKAKTAYHMRANITLPDGTQQQDPDRVFTTGDVPGELLPDSKVTTPSGMTPSPGVELVSLTPGTKDASKRLTIAALDTAGNLIWYYDYDRSLGIAQPIKLMPNGHFLVNLFVGTTAPGGTIREIDLSGATVHEFAVTDLNQWLLQAGYTWLANSIHHDFVMLPNGHLLLLVNTNKKFSDLPGFPGQTAVLGDAIVDLDPDFNPVWVWSTFDHLDVNRHPMMFPDWTHSNSLAYSPDDGNLVLSMRHQSWVIKIDYANGQGTGDILWRLGYGGDFTLLNSTSPGDWFYAQHYAHFVSANSTGTFQLAMFDNGDNRILDNNGTTCGSAGAPDCYSRPAIFQVDENAKTAQVLWAYPTVYSLWGGDIQELPNTNIFADVNTPSDNVTGARVLELTQEANPQTVWQLDINGQNSYRTIHLPSLYPGVQW